MICSNVSKWWCVWIIYFMMTSSNGNFRVTGPLCGEFTGHRWIPPHKGQWRRALMFSLICARINGWVNNCEAGDLRRHDAHYGVTVMQYWLPGGMCLSTDDRKKLRYHPLPRVASKQEDTCKRYAHNLRFFWGISQYISCQSHLIVKHNIWLPQFQQIKLG